jgi:hypothetical protein
MGAIAWLVACAPDPIRVGDLPECDAATAPAVCFEDSFRELEVSIEPLHVLAGDFTGDANLEVVAVGLRGGPIGAEMWPGSSNGPVAPAVDPMVTGCSGYPVAGPLLQTGRDDLMFATCSPRVDVYGGAETGFATPVGIDLPVAPRSSVIIDIEGDADVDLVALGEDTAGAVALSVVSREANGSLGAPTLQLVTGLAFDPSGIRAADFDADRIVDLAIFSPGVAGALGVAHGSGAGSFATPVQLPTELTIHAVAPGDFDGDSDDDLAFADADAGRLCVWIVDAAADPAPFCWPAADLVPASLAAGDIDGDGGDEVVVADADAARVFVWDVDLAASAPSMHEIEAPAKAELVDLVDLEGDGALDLLLGHFAARSISVRLGVPP